MKSRVWVLCGLLLVVGARAEVYRWVDEQGRVHFGDRAPQQVESQKLDYPESVPAARTQSDEQAEAERQERVKRLVRTLEEERLEKEKVAAETKAKEEELEQACIRFANRLKRMDQANLIYDENEDGSIRYYSDDEADHFRASLRQKYEDKCGSR